jgi:hypothetical protein
MPMLLIDSGAVPEFFKVVVWAVLVVPTGCEPKLRLAGVSVTAGAVPVPLSETPCGLSDASSLMVTPAVRLPVAEGENVTETEHVALTASVAGLMGQVFVCA